SQTLNSSWMARIGRGTPSAAQQKAAPTSIDASGSRLAAPSFRHIRALWWLNTQWLERARDGLPTAGRTFICRDLARKTGRNSPAFSNHREIPACRFPAETGGGRLGGTAF